MPMGKRLLLAAGLACLTISTFTTVVRAQAPVADPRALGFDPARLARIAPAFQTLIDQGTIPSAVILIQRHGRVAYQRALGFRDADRKQPITTDAIFRIASMTKPIVTVAAMILVEEGKLDIASPVAAYLPEFKDIKVFGEKKDPATGEVRRDDQPQKRPMTVQDLMRHTAGLTYAPPLGIGPVPKLYSEAGVSTRDEPLATMMTKLSKLPLASQPGEVWEYSVATDVLGRVVEVVSGMDLDRFVESRVTRPLGMTSTGFYTTEANKDRIAQPKVDPATGQTPALFDPLKKPVRLSGGGGMISAAADYARFAQMLLNGGQLGSARILAPSTVALMTADALKPGGGYSQRVPLMGDSAPAPFAGQGFSLGFAVRTEAGQNPLPGSVGSFYWSGAYGTTFFVDPKENLVIVFMTQIGLGTHGATVRRLVRNLTYQALVPGLR